jgi:hypothetical protein
LLVLLAFGCHHGTPATTQPSTAPTGPRCASDSECVLVVGNPCNPCGTCPYEGWTVMNKTDYDATLAAPTCAATTQAKQHMPPPTCSPCDSRPPQTRPSKVACVQHACVAVP